MATENTETALVEVSAEFKSKVAVFNDRKHFDALLAACKAKAAEAGTDVSTAKARDEIKSMAFKIRKVGVVIDDSGAALAEEMRKRVGLIDKSRREYKASLADRLFGITCGLFHDMWYPDFGLSCGNVLA